MPKIVEPKVFILAETRMVEFSGEPKSIAGLTEGEELGYHAFLKHLGVPGWKTDASSDAEQLIEVAGKSCYLSFSTDLNKNLTRVGTRNNQEYIQEGIVKTKHGSVLEHPCVTFAIMDVSRVCTHEIVRHRAGFAFSQVSGRYVRADEIGYFLPKVISSKSDAAAFFQEAFSNMERQIRYLEQFFDINNMKDFGLKKTLTSAFRRIIGNGQANHIIVTANHRALRHVIEMRTSRHAEEEIRHVFTQIFNICRDRYPAIYADAVWEEVDEYPEVVFKASKV